MKHRVMLSLLEAPRWEMLGCKQGSVWNKKMCLAQENPERAKHVCNQLLGKIRDIKRPEDHSKFNSHLLSPLGCQECLDQVCGSLSPAQCHFSKWGFLHSLFGEEGIQKASPSRCDTRAFQHLMEKFPRVEKSLKDLSQKNIILKEALRKFKGTKKGKKI